MCHLCFIVCQLVIFYLIFLLCLVITIKFSKSTYSIDENGGPVQLVLILSSISLIEFTVQVRSIDESASGKFTIDTINYCTCSKAEIDCTLGGGNDYISGPYTVKIPTNVKMIPFSILITDDKKKENNETFRLVIDPHSLRNGVVVGPPNMATVTIVDTTKCKIMLYYSYT